MLEGQRLLVAGEIQPIGDEGEIGPRHTPY